MECSNCGLPIDDGALFCGNCGQRVGAVGQSGSEAQVARYEANPVRLLFKGVKALGVNWLALVILVVISLAAAVGAVLGVTIGLEHAGSARVLLQPPPRLALEATLALVGLVLVAYTFFAVVFAADARREKLGVGEVFKLASFRLGGVLMCLVLLDVIVTVGFGLLIVPGVLMLIWFGLAPMVVVCEGVGPITAFRRSRQLARGHKLELWALWSLLSLIVLVSVIPFVGEIVALVLWLGLGVALAARYYDLKGLQDGQRRPSRSRAANWAVIGLGVVANVLFVVIAISSLAATAGGGQANQIITNCYSVQLPAGYQSQVKPKGCSFSTAGGTAQIAVGSLADQSASDAHTEYLNYAKAFPATLGQVVEEGAVTVDGQSAYRVVSASQGLEVIYFIYDKPGYGSAVAKASIHGFIFISRSTDANNPADVVMKTWTWR